MRREVEKCRRAIRDRDGVPVVGESKSRVDSPRGGRRANAMLIVELIVTTILSEGECCHGSVTDL